jgi:hypothetical protein
VNTRHGTGFALGDQHPSLYARYGIGHDRGKYEDLQQTHAEAA